MRLETARLQPLIKSIKKTLTSANRQNPTTMKAVVFESQGAEPKVGDIDVPKPGPDQILVKSIYTAMNPVYVKPQSSRG